MWTAEYQENFKLLKEKFSTRLILASFKLEYMIIVETNSLDYNIEGVLSQYNKEG